MRFYRALLHGMLLGLLVSCCTINLSDIRLFPKYRGVDPAITPYANEYLAVAKQYGIKFDEQVSIGFMDIDKGNVVGECHYGNSFREIDVDKNYWIMSSETRKYVLLMHEMSHCYCNRPHGYGAKGRYDDKEKPGQFYKNKEGFFPDSCPLSLMFPVIVEDYCFTTHYQEYMDDIFKNCDPY